MQKLDKELAVECKLCPKLVKVKNMRNHVGGHILRAQVGVLEKNLKEKVRDIPRLTPESLIILN